MDMKSVLILVKPQDKTKYAVFNAIFQGQGSTRSTLAKKTDLSKPTISKLVRCLIEDNLVIEVENDALNGVASRRKNMMLKVNNAADYVLAIDLGGSKIRFSIFSLGLKQVISKTQDTYPEKVRSAFLDCLAKDIQKVIIESGLRFEQCSIVSIATAGIVDNTSGEILKGSANLPQWEKFNLSKELSAKLFLPVIIENNVRAALVGERYAGDHGYSHNLMLMCLGAGIGSAVLTEGQLLRGQANAAGEIGLMFIAREQLNMNWQVSGALESYCSFAGLAKRYEDLTGESICGIDIFERCEKGDFTAKSLIDEFSDYLAMSILNTIVVVNPEKVIIYGGICHFSHLFLERTQNIINRQATLITKVVLECSKIGDVSSLIGAAILGLSLKYPKIEFIHNMRM